MNLKKVLLVPFVLLSALSFSGAFVQESDVNGGIVVGIECDAETLLSFYANESYLIQGLYTDTLKAEQARKLIKDKGLYGKVSVDVFDGKNLPYSDNLINLIAIQNAGCKIPDDEIDRVLAPRGVLFSPKSRKFQVSGFVPQSLGEFTKYTKPVPNDIDEWTHFLHDAGNNAVARDAKVGPPRTIQWIAGPLWLRSHETPSGIQSVVSGGGRLFYIHDEGLVGIIDERLPDRWAIYARDAFNGKFLWKRSLEKWGWREWANDKWEGNDWTVIRNGRTQVPDGNQRRIVVDGDRLYVTLSFKAPLTVLDAATGDILKTVKGTEGTEEIFSHQDTVFARTDDALIAISKKDFTIKWRKSDFTAGAFKSAVAGDRLFYASGRNIVALDVSTGKQLWAKQNPIKRISTVTAVEEAVFVLGGGTLVSFNPESGVLLWKEKVAKSSRWESQDLFVVGDIVYTGLSGASDVAATGRNILTGKIEKEIKADNLRSPEHHHRCYRNIATERYIITSMEGAEFLDLDKKNHLQQNWVRGACKLGMVPANGFLYVPPDQCFCSPGAKVLGFTALGSAESRKVNPVPDSKRLRKGEAYGVQVSGLSPQPSEDWPTFRNDFARKGAVKTDVPAKLKENWRTKLGGSLTAPVSVGERVYVACKDNDTLYSLDTGSGKKVWSYTAGGSIDSPPTIYNGLVLLGSRDGYVYCLRASDGKLAWKFLAAPADLRIGAFERIESAWPVHGSVLVVDDIAYFSAGRSSYFDGGMTCYGLNPETGKIIHKGLIEGPIYETGKREVAFFSRGANSDVFVSEGDHVYMRQRKLTKDLKVVDVPILSTKGAEDVGMHVFSTAGLLDDSWYNRTFWMYSKRWPGFQLANQAPKSGQLLVVDEENTYAVKVFYRRNVHSAMFFPGKEGYLLFADSNDNEPQILGDKGSKEPVKWLPQSEYDYAMKGKPLIELHLKEYSFNYDKGIGYTRAKPPLWSTFLPVRIRAMVKTSDKVFVAGPPDVYEKKDPFAAFEGERGGKLLSVSAKDGKKLSELDLDSPPVFDGMIAANKKLYIALKDGSIACFK